MLLVKEVTKKFGGVVALDSVSINFDSKGLTGIIGPNGSGKTTLLNVITGLVKPDRGVVILNGRDITNTPIHERVKMGLTRSFQFPKYFPKFTVKENIALAVGEERAMEALSLVGLAQKANTPAKKLTMYDLRRLEIARILALKPKYALLDEPLSGLSYEESISLIKLLRELTQLNISFIVVEHKLTILFKYADRIVLMASGRVLAEGAPEQIVENKDLIKIIGL
ncbi:ABC transporter ATP-binding protein [Pyrobaculum aerophilum]|uniref:ABC transporter ATP-binding protein n=1 Tax=Pyrobaculum aerophilum TaxID=13773 RepID=A0A371R783_9CREN|nr:ABC transporter ATP-binding protein [Pyrobaculum aerophilum]RFA94017.1 ABC transporter ATP-binding protein [Pyrobaculum aerophilum]RFB00403.1 ABC transporter ATP-binding protein [Pyrobaculum aerophilum]